MINKVGVSAMALSVGLSDKQLLTRFKTQNDVLALEVILYRYKDKLLQSIMFWSLSKDEAEDLVQDTFLKAIQSIQNNKYVDEDKFFAWLIRIAKNQMIDSKRQHKRHHQLLQDVYLPQEENRTTSFQQADKMILNKMKHEKIQSLLNELPESQREVVVMRIYYEMSFNEIAKKLDISLNTALGRMRYGLQKLRILWKKIDESY